MAIVSNNLIDLCGGDELNEDIQCSSHDEDKAFDCIHSDAQNAVYCVVCSTEVDSKDIADIERVRFLPGIQRSLVFCLACGLFRFGSRLTPREKKAKRWIHRRSCWQHTTGKLRGTTNWIFYKLAHLKWTKAFKMVAEISDEGALKFSLCIKNNVVSKESNIYEIHDSADIKTIITMLFPRQVSDHFLPQESGIRAKEDIDGFFSSLQREVPKNWKICTENLVAVLRPYQEDAVRFMISREDPDQQISFNVTDDFVVLPTTPHVLYSPVTGSMSQQLEKPSFRKCHPGGILADEMGLGKTVEVIGLILSHQRGKGLPQVDKSKAKQCDAVRQIVNELVSTVVAAIDGYTALQDRVGPKNRCLFYYNNLESTRPKRLKGNSDELEPLTVTCTGCSTVCLQERVYWDRFFSQEILFLCPECIHNQDKVYPVKGTLIIAPATICHQWYEELRRHIREDVKIDMYRGLVNDGYKHPEYLATQDIVICSFETLRSEIYFVNVRPRFDSLRRVKRDRIAPTPLLSVEWWRICIDEAQMVECTSSSATAMCEGLRAVNRWCVTGTPTTNSLQDLYGLVRFLRVEPFWSECWWRNALMVPYRKGFTEPLNSLFSKILWRNTKKTVGDQMLSPARGSDLTVLRFTPIEEQYYRETLSNCRWEVRYLPFLGDYNAPISSLHSKDFEKLMEPLQVLRKIIVFPGLRFQETRQNVNTEESLQEELFKKTTQHVEQHQRNILMYYSGLAGVEWLCGHMDSAAGCYNAAISAMKELDETNNKLGLQGLRGVYRQLKSDKLQQIHVFSSILDLQKEGIEIAGIDRDGAEAQLNLAFTGYTEQAVSNLTQSYAAVNEASSKYRTTLSKVKSSIAWLCEVTNVVTTSGQHQIFFDAVRTAHENSGLPDLSASNLTGLNLYAVKRWDELVQSVEKVLAETEKMAKNNILEQGTAIVLEEIIACHLSLKDGKVLKRCLLCVYNKCISQLESLLFVRLATGHAEEEEQERGTAGEQKNSSLETILRTFLGLLTRMQKEAKSDLIALGKESVAQLEEFKALLILAKRLYATASEYAAKIDEVRQCKLRLQYATEDEIKKHGIHLPINLIIRGTEDTKRCADLNALEVEKLKQTRSLAKLRYLSNLRTQQTHDCPVCLTTITHAWIVYPCAHCVCVPCFNRLARRSGGAIGQHETVLKCVVCRALAYYTQVSYVQRMAYEKSTHLLDVPNITLKRSVSVKVDAIMRRIKSIRLRDPTSKTLLFTSLSMLIDPLCHIMSENGIIFRNFLSSNRQKVLADFRLNPEIELLIMPMRSGARGLNLTAANNIIFVEPQMDISQIAQAIGRIDRIGQKKEMMVHHFVVYGSIEEQIFYKYSQNQDKDWTIQSIVHLFGLED